MTQNQAPDTVESAEHILQTVGYERFVKALYNRTGDVSKDFTHAILGIVTEIHEYRTATDEVNAIEEGGDLQFYLCAAHLVLNEFNPIDTTQAYLRAAEIANALKFAGGNLSEELNNLLDHAKRWVGYGRAPNDTTTEMYASLVALITYVRARSPLYKPEHAGLYEIVNVKKLLKRYKGMAFNAEHAINRDVASERVVLENAAAA